MEHGQKNHIEVVGRYRGQNWLKYVCPGNTQNLHSAILRLLPLFATDYSYLMLTSTLIISKSTFETFILFIIKDL